MVDSGPDGPTAGTAWIDWPAPDPATARQYVIHNDKQHSFQCRPAGDSGVGEASVDVDYMEVRVRYTAPSAEMGPGPRPEERWAPVRPTWYTLSHAHL